MICLFRKELGSLKSQSTEIGNQEEETCHGVGMNRQKKVSVIYLSRKAVDTWRTERAVAVVAVCYIKSFKVGIIITRSSTVKLI